MATRAIHHGWSSTPGDILHLIFERLFSLSPDDCTDELAVRAVCTWWRAAATDYRRHRPAGRRVACLTPWLLLDGRGHEEQGGGGGAGAGDVGYFHDLRSRSTHRIVIPGPGVNEDFLFVGSSHGWLAAADRRSRLHLLHPITRAVVPLLPPATLHGIKPATVVGARGDVTHYDVVKAVRFNFEARRRMRIDRVAAGDLHRRLYKKVALSSDPSAGGACAAVLIEHDVNHVSFAMAGGERWVKAASGRRWWERNFLFYMDCVHHRGRFYTVTNDGAVEAWDVAGAALAPPEPETIVPRSSWKWTDTYLVSAPWGDLLLVRKSRRDFVFVEAAALGQDDVVTVERVDMVGRRLEPTTSLRGHALLLAPHGDAVCVAAGELPGLGADCVCVVGSRKEGGLTANYAAVYDLGAGTTRPLDPSLEWFIHETGDHPIWITRKAILRGLLARNA